MEDLINKFKKAFNNMLNNKKEQGGHKAKKNKEKNFTSLIILVLVGILFVSAGNLLSKHNKKKSCTGLEVSSKNIQEEKLEKKKEKSNYKSSIDLKEYNSELNDKLKNILGLIDGVGRVDTMIYFDSGEEFIPATNINNSISKTEETDNSGGKRKINQNNDGKSIVTFNDGDTTKPLITKTKNPKITGICIVAEGADDKVTRLRIVEAVVNLFNLPENKVQVYPMKK